MTIAKAKGYVFNNLGPLIFTVPGMGDMNFKTVAR